MNTLCRIMQGLCLALILLLMFGLCDPEQDLNIWAVKWTICMLSGIIVIFDFCKELKETGSSKYP